MKIMCKYDKLVKLNELKQHKRNPNHHSEEQIHRLAKIIDHYGIRHPIIVDKTTGLIVVGHGRLAAAKAMGLETFPVVYQEFKDADEVYSFMVADNGISEWAELNLSMINTDMANLGPDFDIELLGIKDFEIEPSDIMPEKKIDNNLEGKICPQCGYEF